MIRVFNAITGAVGTGVVFLKNLFYFFGVLIAHQLTAGFYICRDILYYAIGDLLMEKKDHPFNWRGGLGFIVGMILGIALASPLWMIRFFTYDLVLGASTGWQIANAIFIKYNVEHKPLTKGVGFWKFWFFSIGIGFLSQYYSFYKIIPWSFYIVWFEQPRNTELHPLSTWYIFGIGSLMIASFIAFVFAMVNFCIRTLVESIKGLMHGLFSKEPAKLLNPYCLAYRFFYSLGEYSHFAFQWMMVLPQADIKAFPMKPATEDIHFLGQVCGVLLGVFIGSIGMISIVIPRFFVENYRTLTDEYNRFRAIHTVPQTSRTPLAIYGYAGFSFVFCRVLGVVNFLTRFVWMTRGRFDELEEKNPEVIKIKNLYATVNNLQRDINVQEIKSFTDKTHYTGGKGFYCYMVKSIFFADNTPSEKFLDKMLDLKKQKNQLNEKDINAIAEGEQLTPEQKEAVVNYIFKCAG